VVMTLQRIEHFHERGLIVRPVLRGEPFTVPYREVLTAERCRQSWRLVLHTRGMGDLNIWCRGKRDEAEGRLRLRGVRVVDCWGAIISPTRRLRDRAGPRPDACETIV
jgi:hypothetical protein